MLRILRTDPELNPGYTEKGRWNFYNCGELTNKNGEVPVSYTHLISTLAKLCQVLDCQPGDLLEYRAPDPGKETQR